MSGVKHTIHKGYLSAWGLFFQTSIYPHPLIQQRILARWQAGYKLFRYNEGYLLLFNRARRINSAASEALVLSKHNGYLASAPLRKREIHTAANTTDSVWVVLENCVQHYRTTPEYAFDPCQWFATDDLQIMPALPMADPPRTIKVASKPTSIKDVFAKLGIRGSRGRDAMLQELQHSPPAHMQLNANASSVPAGASSTQKPGLLQRMISDWAGRKIQQAQNGTGSGLLDKLGLGPLLMQSWLGNLYSKRMSAYMGKLVTMFENGDIENAIRNAIPFGSDKDRLSGGGFRFGLPKPNENLAFSGAGSYAGIGLDERFYEFLRQWYKRCFETLDSQHQYQKAAYVLAELLGEYAEAAAYLEKHGMYELAAQLAERKEMSPAYAVKLWLLAGDKQQALKIARQSRCFAETLPLLAEQAEHRKIWLMLWAEQLLAGGNIIQAIESILPHDRDMVIPWLDTAIACGGQSKAKALALKIALQAQDYRHIKDDIQQLLQNTDQEFVLMRQAFLNTLKNYGDNASSRAVARTGLRALLRDTSRGFLRWDASAYRSMLNYAGDAVLGIDTAGIAFNTPHAWPSADQACMRIQFNGNGIARVYDAYLLPGKRYLLAMGEAGIYIVNKHGQIIKRMDCPAHHLVLSESGNRVIAVARRDRVVRLSKWILHEDKSHFWCETQLQAFSDRFDDDYWVVADKQRLMAVDVQRDDLHAVWQVSDLPGQAAMIKQNKDHFACYLQSPQSGECWVFQLPHYRMQYRTPAKQSILRRQFVLSLSATGEMLIGARQESNTTLIISDGHRSGGPQPTAAVHAASLTQNWVALHHGETKQPKLELCPRHGMELQRAKLAIYLHGSAKVHSLIDDQQLLVWSEQGCLLHVDLTNGDIVKQIQVEP